MELGSLQQDETTAWVKFGEDGEILLAYVPREDLHRLYKKATKRDWKKGQMIEETDSLEANRLLGRASVRDWKNLTMSGQPFIYSPENCDLLMKKSYVFAELVNEKSIEISNFINDKNEESKKNSTSI